MESVIAFPRPVAVDIPDFLTHPRERHIFKSVIEDYLQRRVARKPDFWSFGRWAHLMHRWILCKEQLDGKPTWMQYETQAGKQVRRHPAFRDMLDIQQELRALESDLGLNPLARHTILRGLTAMPASLTGEIVAEEIVKGEAGASADDQDSPPQPKAEAPVSPLGFLHPDKLN